MAAPQRVMLMLRKRNKRGPEARSSLRRLGSLARGPIGRALAKGLLAAGVIIVAGIGLKALEYHVLSFEAASSAAVRVHLADRPGWMPRSLAAEIPHSLAPDGGAANRPDLVERIHAEAMANPWIRRVGRVQKRATADPRVAGVEVLAECHRPVACVQVGRRYVYVSDSGVRLPDHQVPKYEAIIPARAGTPARRELYVRRHEIPPGVQARPVHYIVIYGVAGGVPAVGQAWPGADLADGVRLVKLVGSRKYASQISVVDVRNQGGRIDPNAPHLRMYAQTARGRSTDSRFGQFPIPGGGDFVVSPERKLSYLDQYVARNGGQLAGINTYLDLRYDQLHVSIN